MSEPIGMEITIGGTLPADLIEEFLGAINDDLNDINEGPTTEEELRNEAGAGPIKWVGTANYGLCNDVFAFCEKHNLSYLHHCDAKYEYNATIAYWVPGMKEAKSIESNQEGDLRVDASEVRPLCDLMLSLIQNPDSLATFIGIPGLEEILEKGLKKPKTLPQLLKKAIDKLVPGIPPAMPSFTIKE